MLVASLCLLSPLPSVIVAGIWFCEVEEEVELIIMEFGPPPTIPPEFNIELLVDVTVDTASPLVPKSSDGPDDFLRMEGSSVISSITTLNSSISLNLPVAVIGPADEEEGCLLLLFVILLVHPDDDRREDAR